MILIGPVNAGKSTIAALLAERLNVGRGDLDHLCWGYFEQAGYDPEIARTQYERGGQAGAAEYMVQFYPGAVERILAEYPNGVIDLGAGHAVYDDPEQLERVAHAFAAHPNVVLLMPSPDPVESIRILGQREGNPYPEAVARNENFVRNRSYRTLAKFTVYTQDKSPEETCEEVMALLR